MSVGTLSEKPDFALITIGGGTAIRPDITNVDALAEFPSSVDVISVRATATQYLVKVFVKDVEAFSTSQLRVKGGVIRSFWGKENVEQTVTINMPEKSAASATPLPLWPESGKVFVSESEFEIVLPAAACPVDDQSFAGSNVEILAIDTTSGSQKLRARLVNNAVIGRLTFLGYAPDQCTAPAYPAKASVVVVKEEPPHYTISHKVTDDGCMDITVTFDAPFKAVGTSYLNVGNSQAITQTQELAKPVGDDLYLGINASICTNYDDVTVAISVNGNAVKAPSGADLPETPVTNIQISKKAIMIHLDKEQPGLVLYQNETYVSHEKTFALRFIAEEGRDLTQCDYSRVFTSDNTVELTTSFENSKLVLSITTTKIDRHAIEVHPERLVCSKAVSTKFLEQEIKFAYDPAFMPGDIVVTFVNTEFSTGFKFFPMRTIFTWNKIFFTDAGWADELLGFIDHGTDGFISFTPKTDLPAGSQDSSCTWMQLEMDKNTNMVTGEVKLDYSYKYEHHGFNLEAQDNLFIYVTGAGDLASSYDDWSTLRFIFGIYWSSSEWEKQTTDYRDITSEYSALPTKLIGFNVALGTQANPPRGVNYMVVDETVFADGYTHSRDQILERIVNATHWKTSQNLPFMVDRNPTITYVPREMDFTYTIYEGSICFTFDLSDGITVHRNTEKAATMTIQGVNVQNSWTWSNKYCVNYNIPNYEGEMEVELQPGLFFATFPSIISGNEPFPYESERHRFFVPIHHTPSLQMNFRTNMLYQTLEVSSSVQCAEWGTFTANQNEVVLLSQTGFRTMFAVAAVNGGTLTLNAGFCKTVGERESAAKTTNPSVVVQTDARKTLLSRLVVRNLLTNQSTVSVELRVLAGSWGVNSAVLNAQNVERLISYNASTRVATFSVTDEPEQTIFLPYGVLTNGHEGSQAATLTFLYKKEEVDVMNNHLNLSWNQEPRIRAETVATATFSNNFSVINGRTPLDLLFFEGKCQPVGYVLGPNQSAVVSIAIMHGFCSYGVRAGVILDPFQNTNLGSTAEKEFDFVAPSAVMAVVDNDASAYPDEGMRFYWNVAPVLSIYFDEPIANFDETQALVTVDNCDVAFRSHVVENDKSTIRYTLSNCEGLVTVNVVPDIALLDDFENSVNSQECIRNPSFQFEMDYVAPSVTLETQTSILYTSELDIHYTVSEAETTFDCSDISIAVEEVAVQVTPVGEDICHYTFNPIPVNGTYVLVYMAPNRFQDRARNNNLGSPVLSILAVNLGAQITVEPQEIYTYEVKTEFTLTVTDRYLCPNYKDAFTSTFEFDREIARIDREGEPVELDNGVIQMTYSITFFNMDVYTNSARFKNMAVHIPAMVCSHPLGLHNNALTFHVTFDNKPAEPTVSLLPRVAGDNHVTVEAVYTGVTEFGANDAEDYVVVTFEEAVLDCAISRRQEAEQFIYRAVCVVSQEGHLVMTLMPGAVKERTGLESSEFSATLIVDTDAPIITLAPVQGSTFGPSVTSLPLQLTVSELMQPMPTSCFTVEGAEDLIVSLSQTSTGLTANQVVNVHMGRPAGSSLVQGSFSVYVREQCVQDLRLNWNARSNVVTFTYDFVAPVVTLDCPAQNTVLNTFEIMGSMNKPYKAITAHKVIAPEGCSKSVEALTSTTFRVSLQCTSAGSHMVYISGMEDLVGNGSGSSNTCTGTFTVSGPALNLAVRDLVKGVYVNTKEFAIDVSAAPNCVAMDLTSENVVVENAVITMERLSTCQWVIRGTNQKEGHVTVMVLDRAAVDVYGGYSSAAMATFQSYQSRPEVMTVTPLLTASSVNAVELCFDRTVERASGAFAASGACSSVEVKSIDDNCLNLNVEVTRGERCYLAMEANAVQSVWELGNIARTVMMEVNDHPPALNVIALVGEEERAVEEDAANANIKHIYVNGDLLLSLEVASSMMLDVSRITCNNPQAPVIQQVPNALEIALTFSGYKREVTLELLDGLLTDVFNRKSERTIYRIHYSQEAVATEITMIPYNSHLPINACVSFNSTTFPVSEANVQTTVSFTLTETATCAYQLSFTPEEEGEYAFEIVNVRSIYGNVSPVKRQEFLYFASQPVIVEPFESVETTNLVQDPAFYSTIRLVFSRAMNPLATDNIDELLVLAGDDTPLSTFFQLVSVGVAPAEPNVVLIHYRAVPMQTEEDYYDFYVTFADNAFADLAENTAVPFTFLMAVNNRPTVVESVLHNGGSLFTRLPLTLTVTFSKPVELVSGYASYITASSVLGDLTFAPMARAATNLVTEVTVVSVETPITMVEGVEWTVRVEAGIATDLYGQHVQIPFTSTLNTSNNYLVAANVAYGPNSNPVVHLTMDKLPKTLYQDKLVLQNAIVRDVVIEGVKMNVFLTVPEQGEWAVTFLPESIEGADESLLAETIQTAGIFDSIAPIVSCTLPTAIGVGSVTVECTSDEAMYTDSKLFLVTYKDMVVEHTEILDNSLMTASISFTAVDTYEPNLFDYVYLTLDSCMDEAGNTALPVRYRIPVDFMLPTVTLVSGRSYVHTNETMEILATFSRPVMADSIDLQVDGNEDLVIATISEVVTVTPGLQYAWTVSIEATELTNDVIPVTFTVPAGYADAYGNKNVESSLTVYLNDMAPELEVSHKQVEQVIEVDVTVHNGPIPTIDADMLDLSTNLELIDVVSVQTSEGNMVFTLTFVPDCTESCPYSIRFRPDRIFNLAGNPMTTEISVITDDFVMAPVVTLAAQPFYASAPGRVTLTFSENADMNCASLRVTPASAGVVALSENSQPCLNTKECTCWLNLSPVGELAQLTVTLPPGSVTNRFGLQNTLASEATFYYSPVAIGVTFTTAWTETDSVNDIAFTATTPFNALSEEMVQCVECEITQWKADETNAFAYTFHVTFLNDNGNYARVFVEEGVFVDPFGRKSAPSSYVLRRNAEAAVMQRMTYDINRPHVLELHFSMPVHACGGALHLTAVDNALFSYSRNTADLAITGRRVIVELLPYGQQRYEVTWDENAFCDATNYPVSQNYGNNAFTTVHDVPLPPTLVSVSDITARTATLHYVMEYDGGESIHSVVLTLYSTSSEMTPRLRTFAQLNNLINLSDLEPGTTYVAMLAAVNSMGMSLPSASMTFTTAAATPASATDLRVCNVLNPVTVDGLVTYTEAEACWTASASSNVAYRMEIRTLKGLKGEVQTIHTVEVPTGATKVAFTLANDVEYYRLTLITESTVPVEEGLAFSEVSADFVTRIDLEDIKRFPQGAGIVAVAERLTANSVVVSFNQPLENYFRIEKYQVQFGQSFPEIMDATALGRQTYQFPMDKCVGNQVTLTVRAGIANDFWGLPSNRVVIYCKTPRLQIVADAGFDYVAFRVTSEVKATATCILKAAVNPVELARLTVDVDPVNVAPYQLFKSLNPDTDYIIECMAQDLDYVMVSGQTSFYTTSTFALPELELAELKSEQIGSHYIHIPVGNVNLPGTVYCMAKPVDQAFHVSRSEYITSGFAAYTFPRLRDVTVTITGLKPQTEYRARCMFDPDYSAAKVAARRLVDEEIVFTTAALSVPTWVRMEPFGSAAVPAFTELRFEASLPVFRYNGELRLVAQKNAENTQVFSATSAEVSVSGSVLLVTPRTLVPGEEYALVMTPGFVVDAESYAPMPGVTLAQKVTFTVINDPILSSAPTLLRRVPENESVAEMADSDLLLIFDRSVRLSKSAKVMVSINGEVSLVSGSSLEVSSTSKVEVIVKTGRFFREGASVKVTVLPNSICSLFGACVASSEEFTFTVATKTFAPAFLSIYPANEQTSVPHGEDVVLTFNKEIVLDEDYAVVFVDENNQQVVFRYGTEKAKVTPRLYVEDNKLVVRGDALPAGHTYTIVFDPAIVDKAGRQATGLPAIYRFSTSAYRCSGNYIFEKMGDDCECYSTNDKCECRCGKEDINDVVIGMKL